MKKIYAGIIGCGNIAGRYQINKKYPITHIESYLKIKNVNVIAITDTDSVNLMKFKRKWNIKNYYLSYKEMIKNNKLDIISICVPNIYHYEIIKFCYKYNVKKILCEKPFCENKNQIKNLIKLNNNNFNISINYFRRWNSDLNFLKKKIEKNTFGNIQSVEFNYTKDLLNNGSHLIDYCIYLFGMQKKIKTTYKHSNNTGFDFLFSYDKFIVHFKNIPNVKYTFVEGKIFFSEYLISFNERFQRYSISKIVEDKNYKNLITLKLIKSKKTNWYLSIRNAIYQLINSKNNKTINHSLGDSLILRECYEKIIKS